MTTTKFAIATKCANLRFSYHIRTHLSSGTTDRYYASTNSDNEDVQKIVGDLPITTRDELTKLIVALPDQHPNLFFKEALELSDIQRGYKI